MTGPQARTVAGAACWALTVAYFVVQPLVAAAWPVPYDVSANTISDLGVTSCGIGSQLDGGRVGEVCSPRHTLMNATFVLVGLLRIAGALLTRDAWPARRAASVGLAFVALAGMGGIVVGLAPADVNLTLHAIGASLQVPGAVGPLLMGVALWDLHRRLAVLSVTLGVVGSVASVLYLGGTYLGLGAGGMERLGFDALSVWTIAVGALLLWRSRAGRRESVLEP